MLIWINGAFGSGKTQTAFELQRRVRGVHVADPELLGFALQRMLPPKSRQDFQDLSQWRSAVVETLVQAESAHPGPVIVPMTVVRDDAGLPLTRPRLAPWRYQLRRLRVGVQHIR